MQVRCPKCGAAWEGADRVGVRDECPECAAYIHTCSNCANYDATAGECRIPTTDSVRDRQGQNFCEEFSLTASSPTSATPNTPEKHLAAEDARKRFEDLFRDSSA